MMRFLSRPGFSSPERQRIAFDLAAYWQVVGVRDAQQFFQSAHLLLPQHSFLFLEGGSHPKPFRQWLDSVGIAPQYSIMLSTMFPRPHTVHLEASANNLNRLASFAANMASAEICDHLHAYSGGKIVFAWFDAFYDPILLPISTPESLVSEFSSAVGAKYEASTSTT